MKTISCILLIILAAMPGAVLSQVNYALEFDGNDDYVSLDSRALNGLSACTVEYWIYIIREDVAASPLSGAGNVSSNEYLHFFDFEQNGHGYFPYIKGQLEENGQPFPDGEWFHFAMIRLDEGEWIAYINGEEHDRGALPDGELSIANGGLILGQEQDNIGGGFDAQQALHGMMDELRFWNFPRSQDEIHSTMNSIISPDAEGLVAYYRFDEGEGQVAGDLTENEYDGRLGAANGQDNADPRWIESEAAVFGGVIELSLELLEFGPVSLGQIREIQLLISNIADVDDEMHSLEFSLTDLGEDPDWLGIEPGEGVVGVGEQVEVTFTASTEGIELGEYDRSVLLECNASNIQSLEIPVHLFVVEGFAQLSGTITDEETGDPLAGASVEIPAFDMVTESDEDGYYIFPEIPSWTYDILVTMEDFLPMTAEEVEINPGEDVVVDFGLLHSDFVSNPEEINEQLPLDEIIEVPVWINNPGNGPLTWEVNRVFPEGMEAEPWEHREGLAAGDMLENNRLGGVEFVDGHFYVGGGLSNGENQIYVLNPEGELVRQFDQFVDSRYGFRDMTYDGNLLWGVDGDIVHGFTTEGELEVTFDAPVRSARGITWDRENELLWISGITSDIFGMTRDGELVSQFERPADVRMYGLAWYPDDADGHKLYMFCSNGELNRQIWKFNLETEEVLFVVEPDIEGTAGASTVTRAWDPFSWVFMAITNSPDRIEIWHLEAPTGWVDVNPTEGVLEPGDEIDLTVGLNTFSFPVDIEFTVDLVFNHDGVGGESVIPVALEATEGGGPEQRILELAFGWNMVSVNVDPEENDVIVLTQDLVDNDLLEMMKNGAGQFYSPAFGFNNIPGWNVEEGYMLKVTEACQLDITGMPVEANQPIPLAQGWQMIAYYPQVGVDAILAFSGVVDVLEMAKDVAGRFYSTAFGFSNMGNLREGQGYMVKMSEAIDLVYVVEEEMADNSYSTGYQLPELLPTVTPTGQNMSLLIMSDNFESENGEIGVYASGQLVGSGKLSDGICGIAVWGDDLTTSKVDGALPNEVLEFSIHDGSELLVASFETISGENKYVTDGFQVIRLLDIIETPVQFGIIDLHPNPFNSYSSVVYNLPEAAQVNLALYDLTGRQVVELMSDYTQAGQHSFTLNGAGLSSGVYILQLQSRGEVSKRKLTLIK